jgi:hypothetical protein
MKLEIKGHSGCQVDIVNENGQVFVYKSTQKQSYFNRLKLQGQKQMTASEVCIPNIRVPEIIDIETKEDSVVLKMPYIYSKSFVSYFEYAGFEQINHLIDALCSFLSYEIHKSPMQKVKASVLQTKFEDVKKNTLNNPHLKGDKEIERIIKLSSKYFEFAEDMELPIGKCHGDLTFSNILFSGNDYYLIDFLDSFVESPLLDIVKIRQDSAYLWSELMYSGECDSTRLKIVADKIDTEIYNFASQFDWFRYYKVFQLMNFLRILQYAHEQKVIDYLKNVINDLLYEF